MALTLATTPAGEAPTLAADPVAQSLASGLPLELRAPFRRLARELSTFASERHWRLEIVEYEHEQVRRRIADAVDALVPGAVRVTVLESHADWLDLEQALADAAAHAPLVQVFGLTSWLDPLAADRTANRLRAANLRREAFTKRVQVPVVLWLRQSQVRDWVAHAPDLWSWRSGVHRFVVEPEGGNAVLATSLQPFSAPFDVDARSFEQRRARVLELTAHLAATDQQPASQLRIDLVDELADLHASLGELDQALQWRVGAQSELCQRSGNPHETAINQGKIADILQARGQLDEALRMLRDEVQPAFERLGDVRAKAVTSGKIADILQARGQRDEALRIRQEQELPVYERLGDVRAKAMTMGQIADILQARGQLDEALRTLREEVQPAFERLGDVRSKAVTLGKIADILQARGQLDEAQALHEQRLPLSEAMGDIDGIAHIRYSLAMIAIKRGELDQPGGVARIRDVLLASMKLSRQTGRADFIGGIGLVLAQVLARDGQADEALAVLDQAETAIRTLNFPEQMARVQDVREAVLRHQAKA